MKPPIERRLEKARHKTKEERALLALERESRELHTLLREAPLVKLEKPYQRGWERYFILTEEATRRKDAGRLQELLKHVQNHQFSKNALFSSPVAKKSKRRTFHKHKLKSFTALELIKAQIPEEFLQYFSVQKRRPVTREHLLVLLRSGFGGRITLRYPQYFRRKMEPYMITHRKVALPEVESRLHEIEETIYSPEIHGRLRRMHGCRSWCYDYSPQKENRLKNLHKQEIKEEIHNFNQKKGGFLPPYFILRRQEVSIITHPLFYLMMKLHQHTVLVLNRNWQAISTTTPADALSHLVSGTARGLAIDEAHGMSPLTWKDWAALPVTEDDTAVNTPSQRIRVPTIIILSIYNRVPLKRLKFGFKGLWERDGGRCQYTGRSLKVSEANIDHIHPQSRGGDTSWENCVLSDRSVNQQKAARTPAEAGLTLITHPQRPPPVPTTFLIKNTHEIQDWDHFLPK